MDFKREYYTNMGIKTSLIIILILTACASKLPSDTLLMSQKIFDYLQTASHLDEEQKQAMMNHQPFLGMTFEEASLSMRLVEITVEIFDIPLQAVFTGNNINYVIYFDGGIPNRVLEWSSFTDKDVQEILEDLRERREKTIPPLKSPQL